MADRDDDATLADASWEQPTRTEASIRGMLERSRQDIAAGRTVPLAGVLDGVRAEAERIRRQPAAPETDPRLR